MAKPKGDKVVKVRAIGDFKDGTLRDNEDKIADVRDGDVVFLTYVVLKAWEASGFRWQNA